MGIDHCQWCGVSVTADAAVCPVCMRSASVAARDRVEIDAGHVAGVSDRGRVRARNDDALFVSAPGDDVAVIVVCDGVGSTPDGGIAAQVAADAAGKCLNEAAQSYSERLSAATARAIETAARAVTELSSAATRETPSPASTYASVVWRSGEIAVGWVGDSRAYWLGPESPRLLTVDDTWATFQSRAGRLTSAEIAAYPGSKAITDWLGADAPDRVPHVTTMRPQPGARIVVCSDGLWRYLPRITDLVSAVADGGKRAAALRLSRSLTSYAIAAGGHDNVTVGVLDIHMGVHDV